MRNKNPGTAISKSRKKRIIIVSATAGGYLVIVALLAVIYWEELAAYFSDPSLFRGWISSFGMIGKLVYVLLTAVQVALAIIHDGPIQIAGGYAFGTAWGVALFIAGVEIGSLIAFLLSRRFGRMVINLFYAEEKYEKFFSDIEGKNLYILAFLLYLIPGTPKDMLTYCFGTTKVKLPYFLMIIGVARLPAVLLTVMIAQNIVNSNILMLLSIVSLFALLYFIGMWVRKYLKKHKEQ
jgi:uncharacterized membrane protein YdjX (TVP38/TMEM64 family)